jgi:hypothetical protein
MVETGDSAADKAALFGNPIVEPLNVHGLVMPFGFQGGFAEHQNGVSLSSS